MQVLILSMASTGNTTKILPQLLLQLEVTKFVFGFEMVKMVQ